MNALREREINSNLERRLSEEQKLRGKLKKVIYKPAHFDHETCKRKRRESEPFDCHIALK
jgi:hypothetical protein